MVAITTRPTTVSAHLPATGQGEVAARSGARLALAGSARDDGMTPLEMMDAALSGCLVLSVRIAARQRGWLDRLGAVSVDVTHEKADDKPSRIARFSCAFTIGGAFDTTERQHLIDEAHALCTVGNTLAQSPEIIDVEPEQ